MSSIFIFRSCTFIRCLPPLIRSLLGTWLWLCSLPNRWPMTSVHWTHLPCVVWNTLWIKIVSLIIDDGVARCRMFSTIAPSFISVRISIYSHRLMNNFFIKVKSSTFYKHLQHVKWKYYLDSPGQLNSIQHLRVRCMPDARKFIFAIIFIVIINIFTGGTSWRYYWEIFYGG